MIFFQNILDLIFKTMFAFKVINITKKNVNKIVAKKFYVTKIYF